VSACVYDVQAINSNLWCTCIGAVSTQILVVRFCQCAEVERGLKFKQVWEFLTVYVIY